MNINLLLILFASIMSLLAIICVGLTRKKYGARLNIIFIILIFLFMGILHNLTRALATQINFNKDTALILWKISLIARIFSLFFLLSLNSYILEYNKIKIVPTFLILILAGILIGIIFNSNSISIRRIGNSYIYSITSFFLCLFILIFDLCVILILWLNIIRNFSKIYKIRIGQYYMFIMFSLSVVIALYSMYYLTQNVLFSNLHFIFYIFSSVLVIIALIATPKMFVSLTNNLHDFIIIHKSGILLFSYNFETGKESDDSFLKGSILIGINYILTKFTNKKDQIKLIKTKFRNLIFDYDSNYGYAILLIVDRKTSVLTNAVVRFMKKFNELFQKKLEKLSGLIDVSEFKNTKEIIIQYFRYFI